jgi:TolB-like protein/Flp pilus assembly protein TadD
MRTKSRSFLAGFSAEMSRRRVYPVIVAYALVAWALLQIGEVTFEPLGLPGWAMSALVVLAIAGFPAAAILAWMFDITPFGVRRDASSVLADTTLAESPSVAVLPFTDMSREKDQGYFCDGVAEAILHALTRIKSLHVAARMSSFRYATANGDVRDLGRKLGVKAILEGSVRKSGDRLRVTAQLVNVEDGYHLWSKTFDRELKDIFVIQDEIATSIAGSLLKTINPVSTTSTRDVVAYEYYLRGRHFLNRFRKTDFESARKMFHASDRALVLGPELAEAHASAGLAHLVSESFDGAEQELNKAIEINPDLFEAYYYFARTRFHQGDMEGAAELFAKAASVNPEDYQSRLLRVQILRGAGRLGEAKTEARQAIEVVERRLEWSPDDVRALLLGAGSLIVLGEIERAERWMQRALEIDPDDPISLYNLACNYAILNKVEEALGYLERATEIGTVSEDWMRSDEDLANLRSHARYKAILEKVAA